MQLFSLIDQKRNKKLSLLLSKRIMEGFGLGIEFKRHFPDKKKAWWLNIHLGFHTLILHYVNFGRK